MRLKRFFKTAVAIAPLVVGAASPAHGCLVLPDNQGTQTASEHSGQITCGNVGCGPNAPFEGEGLHTAADHSPAVEPEEGGMFVVPVGK